MTRFTSVAEWCEHLEALRATADIVELLSQELPGLLSQYSYNESGSDYMCCFCAQTDDRLDDEANHRPDCSGIRLKKLLARLT